MAEVNTRCSVERVRELLALDDATGALTWKVNRPGGVRAGQEAGCLARDGYIRVGIDGRLYLAHVLAFALAAGRWPEGHIDHVNGWKVDNRPVNLRETDRATNMQNRRRASRDNKAGKLGVTAHPNGKFRSTIRVGGKQLHLGYFLTADEAHEAYLSAKRQHHKGCTL